MSKTTLTIEVTPEWLEQVKSASSAIGVDMNNFIRTCVSLDALIVLRRKAQSEVAGIWDAHFYKAAADD